MAKVHWRDCWDASCHSGRLPQTYSILHGLCDELCLMSLLWSRLLPDAVLRGCAGLSDWCSSEARWIDFFFSTPPSCHAEELWRSKRRRSRVSFPPQQRRPSVRPSAMKGCAALFRTLSWILGLWIWEYPVQSFGIHYIFLLAHPH